MAQFSTILRKRAQDAAVNKNQNMALTSENNTSTLTNVYKNLALANESKTLALTSDNKNLALTMEYKTLARDYVALDQYAKKNILSDVSGRFMNSFFDFKS